MFRKNKQKKIDKNGQEKEIHNKKMGGRGLEGKKMRGNLKKKNFRIPKKFSLFSVWEFVTAKKLKRNFWGKKMWKKKLKPIIMC